MRIHGGGYQRAASELTARWYRTEDRRDRVFVWIPAGSPNPRTIVLPDGRTGRLLFDHDRMDRAPAAGDLAFIPYSNECLDDVVSAKVGRMWPSLLDYQRERYADVDEFAAAVRFIVESDAREHGVHELTVLDEELAHVLGQKLSESGVPGSEGSRSFQCYLDGRAADWGQEARRGPAPSLTERI